MRKALALTLTLVFFWSGIAAPANNSRARLAPQDDDTTIYKVIVNHEEQYSIWPAHRENALGWKDVGKTGTKAECLAAFAAWQDGITRDLWRRRHEEVSSDNHRVVSSGALVDAYSAYQRPDRD